MSLEITYVQNFLVKDSNLLKLLLVAFGFGSQTFICGFSRQNICSVLKTIDKGLTVPRGTVVWMKMPLHFLAQFVRPRDFQ